MSWVPFDIAKYKARPKAILVHLQALELGRLALKRGFDLRCLYQWQPCVGIMLISGNRSSVKKLLIFFSDVEGSQESDVAFSQSPHPSSTIDLG